MTGNSGSGALGGKRELSFGREGGGGNPAGLPWQWVKRHQSRFAQTDSAVARAALSRYTDAPAARRRNHRLCAEGERLPNNHEPQAGLVGGISYLERMDWWPPIRRQPLYSLYSELRWPVKMAMNMWAGYRETLQRLIYARCCMMSADWWIDDGDGCFYPLERIARCLSRKCGGGMIGKLSSWRWGFYKTHVQQAKWI
jgi:hypothetical protein